MVAILNPKHKLINFFQNVQHIEFFHRDHFEYQYHRKKAKHSVGRFIDFFWETDFDALWSQHPAGFSDILYPDIGYTYLINLGTPFIMQLDKEAFEVKSDGFLPRYKHITCHHSVGNKIFGIKFKVSPVIFEKKINFSEYREYIFPLAYLIDRTIIEKVKKAASFQERVSLISDYYSKIIHKYSGSLKQVDMVTEIVQNCYQQNEFDIPIEVLAQKYGISSRTLQRYFEATTSISSKQALQMMRIRKAIKSFIQSPSKFDSTQFGYYDYSHFYKHLHQFLRKHPTAHIQSHLQLLQGSGATVNY